MMKTRVVLLWIITVMNIGFFSSCSEKPSLKEIDIKWVKIFHGQKKIDFCEINLGITAHDTLLYYSHSFTIGGGFKILKANFKSDSLASNVLLETENKVVSHVTSGESITGCVQHDLENHTLRTTLLVADDSTYSWIIKEVPITGLRKIVFLKDLWIIEGSLNGTGQVFKSVDKGNSWRKVNLLARGYKSFYLLTPLPLSNSIFCVGSTSYNERNSSLVLFDTEEGSIEEIIHIDSSTDYIQPISKEKYLHAILDGGKINLYSYLNRKLHLENKIKMPQSDCKVMNLYVNEDLFITTTQLQEVGKKAVSWISYDRGNKWEPFYQEKELRLIYNPMGELFMVDSENNILRGYY